MEKSGVLSLNFSGKKADGEKGIGVEADPRGSKERDLLQGRAGGKHAADSRFIRSSD